ncbi:MAG: DUF4347 domain-containing protein [Burkholderiales bacterium]
MNYNNAPETPFVDAPVAGTAADMPPAPAPQPAVQFLFIDWRVADADTFLANVDPAIFVVRLDAIEDGLTQIARALAGRTDVSAIHIVSHGDPGSILLGNGTLDFESLDPSSIQLATIRGALTPDADVLLYGCDVAADAKGMAFLTALADATGADVAASANVTGSALVGGDWALEAHVGAVQTLAIDALDYSGSLGSDSSLPSGLQGNGPTWSWGGQTFQTRYNGEITTSDPLNPLRSGSRWDRYALDGVPAGSTVRVYMGNSSTVDDYIQIERNGSVIVQNDDGGDGERSYDAYVSWTYQPGDVIRATTYSSGNTGTYSLWISSSAGTATVGDIGNAPAPAPPPATAPTFTDGFGLLHTYNDSGALDTFTTTTGTLTAADSTPNGGMTFSVNGSNVGGYGTLSVASNGSFSYVANASAINGLAAGANATDTFTVRVTDGGGLFSSKTLTVNVTGANEAPTLATDASMPRILEDASATNAGATVASVFGPRFADADTGASLGGIVIVGNDANAGTEGRWQYSTDGGSSWFDVGSVSAAAGLTLSASARLHFVPVANYNGAPGTLTVNGTDNSFVGTYTSGATRVSFDTTSDALTSGVSVATHVLDISVMAVNDAPVFTSNPGAATITETGAYDSSLAAGSGSLSGTLTASDVENDSIAYSIRGGSLLVTTWTKVGLYGTLTLDASTHAWSYAPSNLVALNGLGAGQTAHDLFDFKVADASGAYTTQQIDITLNGTNDVPVLAAAISDQSFSGSGSWSYQIPATAFTDAEGTGLTYTATLSDESPLPDWLSFDEGSRTFSGNPPANWGDQGLTITVTATDDHDVSVTDTFDLTLSGTANQAPVVSAPLALQVVAGVTEVTTVTFDSALGGTTVIFDGQTVTVGSAVLASDVANAVVDAFAVDALNSSPVASYGAAIKGGSGNENVVVLTADASGERSDFTDNAMVDLDGGTYTVHVTTQGATATHESVVVTFDSAPPAGATRLNFDGQWMNVTGVTDAEGLATALANGILSSWTAVQGEGSAANTVTLTHIDAGNVTNLTGADFSITSHPALATVADPTTEGDDAVASTVTVDIADQAGSVYFFSISIGGVASDPLVVTAHDGTELAAAIQSHLQGAYDTSLTAEYVNDLLVINDAAGRSINDTQFLDSGAAYLVFNTSESPGHTATAEVVTVTFAAANGATSLVFDGTTIALTGTESAYDVVIAVIQAQENFPDWYVSSYSGGALTLTALSPGPTTDLTDADFVATLTAPPDTSVTVVTDGIDTATEVAELTFTGTYGGASIVLDGVTATAGAAVSGADVASALANASHDLAGSDFASVVVASQGDIGTFERTELEFSQQDWAAGATVTLTLPRYDTSGTAFTVTTAPLPGIPTGEQIAAAVLAAIATLPNAGPGDSGFADFTAVNVNQDGTNVGYGDYMFQNDGGVLYVWSTSRANTTDLTAGILEAHLASNYEVSDVGDGAVVITALAPGAHADISGASFTGTFGVPVSIDIDTQGSDWSYQIPAGTFTDAENDILTYAAYAIDGNGTATLIGNAGGALSFDPATATLSGTGAALPSNLIEIRATDATGSNTTTVTRLPLFLGDSSHEIVTADTAIGTLELGSGAGTLSAQLPGDAFVYTHLGGTLTYSATLEGGGALPSWLSFDAATATFSGNPPNGAESLSVVVHAIGSNWEFGAVTSPFTLAVGSVNSTTNDPLVVVAPIADTALAAGNALAYSVSLPFSDPDGGEAGTATPLGIIYTATANGQSLATYGLAMTNDGNGHLVFSGNPPGGQPYLNIVVTGTEESGGSVVQTSFTLELGAAGAGALSANNTGTIGISGTPTQGQTLTAGLPEDADGYTGGVVYQWQVSHDNGETFTDVAGLRGQAATISLSQAEVGQVRLQAFYTDNGGVAEAPVSTAVTVANLPEAGVVTMAGSPSIGQTVSAALTDPDGLTNATPTYQWYRGTTSGTATTAISGATYSSYTVTNADGGNFLRVVVTYTDDQGGQETPAVTTAFAVTLGDVAPVGVNDTGTAIEAGGLNNATAGSAATGNLVSNDTDINSNISLSAPIASVRSGGTEGLGNPADDNGTTYTVAGLYGTLVVNKSTGAYTYTVNDNNSDVEALNTGNTLVDRFNYSVQDTTLLTDTAVLSITINGSNDTPSLAELDLSASFTEDIAAQLRTGFTLVDPDLGTSFILKMEASAGHLIAAGNTDVTVTGSDTGTLIVSGTMNAVQLWLGDGGIQYVGAPNANNGNGSALLTYSVNDGSGYVVAGTTALSIAPANDAPTLDLSGSEVAGNNFVTTFRPRGAEVAVVASDAVINDIDDTLMTGGTVAITAGASDNVFGTIYETLRSTAGSSFTGASGGVITITGNGTTALTFSGSATSAEYAALLKTVFYNDANPNAFKGDRTITISVTDAGNTGSNGPLAANTAAFTTTAANNLIAVGQHIYIGGTDTGQTVATVLDNQHFIASGALAGLAANSALSFYAQGESVTTATQAGPVATTTTVHVPWTPVIDMNGDSGEGRDNAVVYTEGGAGVAVASADASITDQDGNIAQVVVTLTNHPDGSSEQLMISSVLVTQLAALGITVSNNNSHAITLSGNKDSTVFQVGLRAVQYINTSENPNPVDRIVSVNSLDMDENTGVGAQTVITVRPVNDAPNGIDSSVTGSEDSALVLSLSDFAFSDPVDGAHSLLAVKISTLPTYGVLMLDGVAVTAGQVISLTSGTLTYLPGADRNGSANATFTFQVQDNGGTLYGGVDLDPTPATMTINVTPVNDAPVLGSGGPDFASITEDDTANGGQAVSALLATITDVDTGTNAANNANLTGMAVRATSTGSVAGGTWQYNLNDSTGWHAIGVVSDSAALLLRSTDLVRFVPDAIGGTTGTLSYYAWDQASGSAGTTVDVSTRGGTTPYSLASDTASITVTDVNDAPTISAPGAQTAAEDGSTAITGLSFGDVDITGRNDENTGNDNISITLTVAHGSITLAGTNGITVDSGANGSASVTLHGSLSAVNTAVATLTYAPAADYNGSDSLAVSVNDLGNVGSGGPLSASTSIDISVTPVNDAPVLSPAAPVLDGISEDNLTSSGSLVSSFVAAGIGSTGIADVDTGTSGANNATGHGIAVYGVDNVGPAPGGSWQYSVNGGNTWAAVGNVSDSQALLLRSTDLVRFVPDGLNATVPSLNYYAWDGAAGTQGNKVDVSTRGGTTAFSLAGDSVSINITPVNDAPTIDLDGNNSSTATGNDFVNTFRARGGPVAVVDTDITISDPDRLGNGSPDTLTSARLTITSGDLDNAFGTTYETLYSTLGASYAGSLGTITFSGNGTTGSPLLLSGAGTWADYQNALKTVVYNDTNPNAFAGDRTIQISVHDAAGATAGAGALDSAVATTTIHAVWAPVADLDGSATTGRSYDTTFTEGMSGVAIAAANASIVDQDGNIASVTVTLTNIPDTDAEELFISDALVTQLTSAGITVTGNHSHAITLSGNRDGTTFQLGLRAIQYVNTSDNPTTADRTISVALLDQQGNTGVGANTIVHIVNVNDAPVGVDSAFTMDEDSQHVFGVADFGFNDVEGNALLSVKITTLPSAGQLTLDGSAVIAGQFVTVADIVAGRLVFSPAQDANDVQNPNPTNGGGGYASLTYQVRDDGGTANSGVDFDTSANTLTINVTPVNDLPTGGVFLAGTLQVGQLLSALDDAYDVDGTEPMTYQWQTRALPSGAWTNISGATAATYTPVTGDANKEIRVVATYPDTLNNSVIFTSDVAGSPQLLADASGNLTVTLGGSGPMFIDNPLGDITVTNNSTDLVTVGGMTTGHTVTTIGTGPIAVAGPQTGVTVNNTSTGTITVTGMADATLTTTGTGATTVFDPADGASVINNGTGTTTVAGVDGTLNTAGTGALIVNGPAGASVITDTGSGSLTVNDPAGDLSVDNVDIGDEGASDDGTVTINRAGDGSTVTTRGGVILAGPLGDLTIDSPDGGTDTVTGLLGTATLTSTSTGLGDTTVVAPASGASVVSDGSGTITVTGVTGTLHAGGTGATVVEAPAVDAILNQAGSGSLTVNDPAGDVSIDSGNAGGSVVVSHAHADSQVTLTGAGAFSVVAPESGATVVNNGSGIATVTGVNGELSTRGSGPIVVDHAAYGSNIGNFGDALTVSYPDSISVVNDSEGAIVLIDHPRGCSVLTTGGASGFSVTHPGNGVTLVNNGQGMVTVHDVDGVFHTNGDGTTVIDAPAEGSWIHNDGGGTVTVSDFSAGNLSVYNGHIGNGGSVTVVGPAEASTITTSGAGDIAVAHPLGDLALAGDSTGTVIVTDLLGTSALTTTGSGPTSVNSPDADAAIVNNGSGALSVDTPAGNLVVANNGEGSLTVHGAAVSSTINTTGAVTLVDPQASLTLTGTGTNTVTGLLANSILETASGDTTVTSPAEGTIVINSGTGDVVVDTPAGYLSVSNSSSGTFTINGAHDGSVISTYGPVTLADPLGDLILYGAGPNIVTGLTGELIAGSGETTVILPAAGSRVVNGGDAAVRVDDPMGDFSAENSGTGSLTIHGAHDASTITTTGAVTLADPAGDLTLAGNGTNTVTGLTGELTTTGSGPTTVSAPAIDASVVNSGDGAFSVDNPVGDLAATNSGEGSLTIHGAHDASIITTSGEVTLADPAGDLTLAGTGSNTVTGLTGELTTSGSGPTTVIAPAVDASVINSGDGAVGVDTPAGNLVATNSGEGSLTIHGAHDESTITTSGEVTLVDPVGDLTLAGQGSNTVTGLTGELTTSGSGPTTVNAPTIESSVINSGDGAVSVDNLMGNLVATNSGEGSLTIHGAHDDSTITTNGEVTLADPAGDLTLAGSGNNIVTGLTGELTTSGSGPTTVTSPSAGSTVINSGDGAVSVDTPAGNLVATNSGEGSLTVHGAAVGSTINTTGAVTLADPLGDLTLTGTGTNTVTGLLASHILDTVSGSTTVTSPGNGVIVINSGIGAVDIDTPVGNLSVSNTSTGSFTIHGAHNGSFIATYGPVTLADPIGDLTLGGAGPNIVTGLTGELTAGGIATTVIAPAAGSSVVNPFDSAVIVNDPMGDFSATNSGEGSITIHRAGDDSIITTSGGVTLADPAGDVTLAGNGSNIVTGLLTGHTLDTLSGDTTVTSPAAGSTVINSGNGAVSVDTPAGNLVATNSGEGSLTIHGVHDDSTITTSGEVTLADPAGDVTLAGSGNNTVTGLTGELTTSGSGPTTVIAPAIDASVINSGDGAVSVDTPAGNLVANNSGEGSLTIHGAHDDSIITTSGEVTLADPAGDLTLAGNGSNTVTGLTGELTTSGSGPTTVIAPAIDASVINSGDGAVSVDTPAGNLVANNSGEGSLTIHGAHDDSIITTSGEVTLVDPLGDLTLAGSGDNIVSGLLGSATLSTTGSGDTSVAAPASGASVVNTGSGTITVGGVTGVLHTAGSGDIVVDAPAAGATLADTGSGTFTVNQPAGSFTLDNQGGGSATVNEPAAGSSINSTGEVSLVNPLGDLTLAGPGINTVYGLLGDATLDVTGSGSTTVVGAVTGATINNTGTGTISVGSFSGTIYTTGSGGSVVDAPAAGAVIVDSGSGPLTVNNPAGDITVSNGGGGTAAILHAVAGSTVTTAGPVTVSDPLGSFTLAGSGSNNVNGLLGNAVLTTTGSGATTLAAPDTGASVVSNGSGTLTVTGVVETLNTGGSGITEVTAPAAGAVVHDTGSGALTITDPAGDLTVDNGGGGSATVTHAVAGSTVTTSGEVTLSDPLGDLTLAGTGFNTVTGLVGDLTSSGSGSTTVTAPPADTHVLNSGSGAVSIFAPVGDLDAVNSGSGSLTVHGAAAASTVTTSGAVTIADPAGDITLEGTGTNTVTGLSGTATLVAAGSGDTTVSAPGDGASLFNEGSGTLTATGVSGTLHTDGTGAVIIDAPADGAVIDDAGSGALTVNDPAGDISVSNGGGGTAVVNHAAAGSTVITSGAVTLADPLGSFTLDHADGGVVTVHGLASGATVSLVGDGPVVIDTHLAHGEHITVDTTLGGNVQISNTGAGTVDVVGSLSLGHDVPLEITLTGNGATSLTASGAVALDNTPLVLELDYTASVGDHITLLSSSGSGAITGTFAGKPEGATFYLQGQLFSISYVGGDGNDIVLSRVNDAVQGAVGVSGTATQGEVLTASQNLSDTDGLGAITYAWMRGDTIVGSGLTYTLTQNDVGSSVRAVASFVDGQGTLESINSAATAAVANVNDLPTGSVRIVGTPTQGNTLTASHTLADVDGLGVVTYRWVSGEHVLGTGDSYTLGQSDVGLDIQLLASYTDGQGTTEHVGSAAVAVANVNDAPTGTVQISGITDVGQTLTASNSLADADGLGTIGYTWFSGGTVVGHGDTYLLSTADVGHSLHVTANYTDLQGSAEVVASLGSGVVNVVNSIVEAGVPAHGSLGVAGDGNGDGIADVLQADVVSARIQPVNPSAPLTFVTLVADSNHGQTVQGSGAQIVAFMQGDTFTAPPMAQMPLGETSFTATGMVVGAMENFSLYVDASVGANGFWVHDATGTLVNLASAAFGGQVVQEGDRTRLDFQVADGSRFDQDASLNGSVDISGLAGHMPLSLIAYTPDLPNPGTQTSFWS